MDTSIRVIGQVTLTDGSCRQVYECGGVQYIADDDGQLVVGNWLLLEDEEPCCPCDLPMIVYQDGKLEF